MSHVVPWLSDLWNMKNLYSVLCTSKEAQKPKYGQKILIIKKKNQQNTRRKGVKVLSLNIDAAGIPVQQVTRKHCISNLNVCFSISFCSYLFLGRGKSGSAIQHCFMQQFRECIQQYLLSQCY